jgi:hypothetical protein
MASLQKMKCRSLISRMKEVRDSDFKKYHDEMKESIAQEVKKILESV